MRKKTGLSKLICLGVAICLLVLLATFGCAKETTPTQPAKTATPAKTTALTPVSGGTLKITHISGPGSAVGWPAATVGSDGQYIKPVCIEPFLNLDNTGRILPWLAASWQIAPDKKSITFTLRKDVKFHDGTDFNAQAVKFNLDALKAAKKSGTDGWDSVEVVDDYTVRLLLPKWNNILLNNLAISAGVMVSPTAYNTKGKDWANNNPVGTGPFQFVSFERAVSLKLKKFDNYWQKGKPYLDALEYAFITDATIQEMALQTGERDVIYFGTAIQAANLKAKGFQVNARASSVITLMPDSANPASPLSKKDVRVAMEYAIDKEGITKALGYGLWTPAYQIPPSNVSAYNPSLESQYRKYNPDKAKQLLAGAGYPNGFSIGIIAPMATNKDILVAIQTNLAAVGINLEIQLVDPPKKAETNIKGWSNAVFFEPATCGNPDWLANLAYPISAKWYPCVLRVPGFQEAYDEAVAATDFETQKAAMQKTAKAMFDEQMYIPLYVDYATFIYSSKVHDGGFGTSGHVANFTPYDCWLSK
jgi:peptide/nickel transport system substrate-binding protein